MPNLSDFPFPPSADDRAAASSATSYPLGDGSGRFVQNGVIVSAGDAAGAAKTNFDNAAASANGGFPMPPASSSNGSATPSPLLSGYPPGYAPRAPAPGINFNSMPPGYGTDGRPVGMPDRGSSRMRAPGIDATGYPPGYSSQGAPAAGAPPAFNPNAYPPGYDPARGGIDVNGYVGSRYAPDFARNNPQFNPNSYPPGYGPTSQSWAAAQELLGASGKVPGRVYNPATIASATPAQLLGEAALLPQRLNDAALARTLPMPPASPTSPAPGIDYTQPPPTAPGASAPRGIDYTQMPPASPTAPGVLTPAMVNAGPPAAPNLGLSYFQNGGRDLKTAEALGKLGTPPKPDRTGQMITIGGKPFYYQNNNQVAPVPPAKATPTFYDQPKVVDVSGQKFYQEGPGQAFKPVPQGNGKGTGGLDPNDPVAQQIQALQTEKGQRQVAITQGDNRFGFLGIHSNQDRINEIDAQLGQLRDLVAKRGTGNGAGGAPAAASATPATAAPAASSAPAPGAQKQGAQRLYTMSGTQVNFGADRSQWLQGAQQAVNDGVITADQARAFLTKAGYTSKGK